jgi:hypothetical protein
MRRQSSLLYRRLAIELAIRLEEYQTAADILSQGLKLDGLSDHHSIDDYLILPGIYNVLPLLARAERRAIHFLSPRLMQM